MYYFHPHFFRGIKSEKKKEGFKAITSPIQLNEYGFWISRLMFGMQFMYNKYNGNENYFIKKYNTDFNLYRGKLMGPHVEFNLIIYNGKHYI